MNDFCLTFGHEVLGACAVMEGEGRSDTWSLARSQKDADLHDNLAKIQQCIEYFNALAGSPGRMRFEINIVDIGAGFAYKHGEAPRGYPRKEKINEIEESA
jgi:hypothetical protein